MHIYEIVSDVQTIFSQPYRMWYCSKSWLIGIATGIRSSYCMYAERSLLHLGYSLNLRGIWDRLPTRASACVAWWWAFTWFLLLFALFFFFFSFFLCFSRKICVSFCLPTFVAGNLLYVLNWFVTSDYIRCIMWYFVTLAPFPCCIQSSSLGTSRISLEPIYGCGFGPLH